MSIDNYVVEQILLSIEGCRKPKEEEQKDIAKEFNILLFAVLTVYSQKRKIEVKTALCLLSKPLWYLLCNTHVFYNQLQYSLSTKLQRIVDISLYLRG